jgi:uncharacterized protein YegL
MNTESVTATGEQETRIEQLNRGLELFRNEIKQKKHAEERIDLAIVTFGGEVNVRQKFASFRKWSPEQLTAQGDTPMGEGLKKCIELVEEQKSFYRENGVQYNRPLLWLLTDGEPTDMEPDSPMRTQVQQMLQQGTNEKQFRLFAMTVEDADRAKIQDIIGDPTGRPVLTIKEGMFAEYFQFLSNSLETVSRHSEGDSYTLSADDLEEFTQID